MKKKLHLVILALLGLTCIANAGEPPKPDLEIQYNSSGLTVITVESNKLNCTWHTLRKDLMTVQANLESLDKHHSSITLTPSETDTLLQWARDAIQTNVTGDQQKSRRGYSTVLSVRIDGKAYRPNHDTVKGFKNIVSEIVKSRRKEKF